MPQTARRLLLIFNSTVYGRNFLYHVESDLKELLGKARHLLFIPFALNDRENHTAKARKRLEENGTLVVSLRANSWLAVDGDSARLNGIAGARVFRRGFDPVEVQPGSTLDPYIYSKGVS